MTISIEDLHRAHKIIKDSVVTTPLHYSPYLSKRTDNEVYLKLENLQRTGSFKARGACNVISQLDAEAKKKGVITCSAGNHGQAIAYACSLEGIRCVVVMPESSPKNKADLTREHNGEVIFHEDLNTLFDFAHSVAAERNLQFVHSFDHEHVIAGQGTVGLEILEQLPDVEVIATGVGGGGLLSGLAIAVSGSDPKVQLYGIEPVNAATMTAALKAGKPVTPECMDSLADGLKPPHVGVRNLDIVQRAQAKIVLVEDEEIVEALRITLDRVKILLEPAGAAVIAALLNKKIPIVSKKIALVCSGGNLCMSRLKEWI